MNVDIPSVTNNTSEQLEHDVEEVRKNVLIASVMIDFSKRSFIGRSRQIRRFLTGCISLGWGAPLNPDDQIEQR